MVKFISWILVFLFTFVASGNLSYAAASEESNGKEIVFRFSPEFSGLDQFYREDLSQEEITEINKLYDWFTKNLIEKASWQWAYTSCNSELTKSLQVFYQSLLKFVDTKNVSAYKAYVIRNSVVKNLNGTIACGIDLEKKYKAKPLLDERMKSAIDDRIAAQPKQKQAEAVVKLKKYLSKIQTKAKSDKTKRLIMEMLAYLDDKLDEIEGSSLLPSDFSEL